MLLPRDRQRLGEAVWVSKQPRLRRKFGIYLRTGASAVAIHLVFSAIDRLLRVDSVEKLEISAWPIFARMRMSFGIRALHDPRSRPQVLRRYRRRCLVSPQPDTGCTFYKRLWNLSVRKKRVFQQNRSTTAVHDGQLSGDLEVQSHRTAVGHEQSFELIMQYVVLSGMTVPLWTQDAPGSSRCPTESSLPKCSWRMILACAFRRLSNRCYAYLA
jgi:hypothetical protein